MFQSKLFLEARIGAERTVLALIQSVIHNLNFLHSNYASTQVPYL